MITRTLLEEEEWCHFGEVSEMKAELPAVMVDWRVLNSLINKHALLALAGERERVAGEEKFRANLGDHKRALKLSDEAFEQRLAPQLARWHLTKPRWEQRNIENCITQAVLQRDVDGGVTDDEVVKYYQTHAARFNQPETIRVQRILYTTIDPATGLLLPDAAKAVRKQQLEATLARARSGTDFTILVKESLAGALDANAGECSFPRGQMAAEIDLAAFALRTNEISGVIESDNGYQIIKLIDRIEAKRQTLPEATAAIRASLVIDHLPAYLEKVRREAQLAILDPALQAEATASEHPVATLPPSAGPTPFFDQLRAASDFPGANRPTK